MGEALFLAKGELLLEACRDRRAKDAMRLIDDGAAVDSVSKNEGWTPLITASSKGLEAVAARLVEAGATLDIVSNIGWSALMEASSGGHTAIARLLADKGAELDLVENHGCSALMHASLRLSLCCCSILPKSNASHSLSMMHNGSTMHQHGFLLRLRGAPSTRAGLSV